MSIRNGRGRDTMCRPRPPAANQWQLAVDAACARSHSGKEGGDPQTSLQAVCSAQCCWLGHSPGDAAPLPLLPALASVCFL